MTGRSGGSIPRVAIKKMIKGFKCGLCKRAQKMKTEDLPVMTRETFRKHLREVHHKTKEIFNRENLMKEGKKSRQSYIIEVEY